MSIQPGYIILLGSGETAPSIRKVYHWLFEQIERPIKLSILETPAGFEPNSEKVAQNIADFIAQRLQNFEPQISIVPARKRGTPFSPDDPDIIAPLLKTNVIFTGPGSPTYTARQLHNSLAWHTLVARHRLGAHLIFASAATVAVGPHTLPVYEIYKVGEDLHWKRGLNLLESFGLSPIFIPHWNNSDGGTELDTSRCYIGQQRYNQLIRMLPEDQLVVGLDEHTALVIDPADRACRVLGSGRVRVIRDGRQQIYDSGQSFSIAELGDYQPAEPQADIPAEVWERAYLTHLAIQQQGASEPPAEVLDLVEKREAVRANKEWAVSDAMRAQIEALGWKVKDTAEGTVLEPI